MKKILFKIEYDGAAFHGWQVQPNGITVQEVIQEKLEIIVKSPVFLRSCSRTDAGVHALGQAATAHIPQDLPLYKLFKSLNALLPREIAIVDLVEVDEDFNVRKGNRGKRYYYLINNSLKKRALGRGVHWWVRGELDHEKMQRAANDFLGVHDFSAFQAKGCQAINTTIRISSVDLEWREEGEHTTLSIVVEGSSFLRNMVRIMVGSLVEIGLGKLPVHTIRESLLEPNRSKLGITAPPQGLCLDKIYYEPDPFFLRNKETWNQK